MRTKIEVRNLDKQDGKNKVRYTVEMAVGPYGSYRKVLEGLAVNEDRAFEKGESEAKHWLTENYAQRVIARKLLNL